MKSKRTKACDISAKVRKEVYERDSKEGHPCCIFCGSPYNLELMHYIGRAQGGLGIPENLAVGCNEHHIKVDSCTGDTYKVTANGYVQDACADGDIFRSAFRGYLQDIYPNWDIEKLIYKKW